VSCRHGAAMVECFGRSFISSNRKKMTAPLRLSAVPLAFIYFWLSFAGLASAQTSDTARQQIDSVRAALVEIDASFKSGPLSDSELQRLRGECDPLVGILQSVLDELAPKLAASAKRLAELTPKSKDKTPDNDGAAAEIAAEQKTHDDLDVSMRTARALVLQIDETSGRISAARRALFAEQTFARSTSILSPLLWTSVIREVPYDVASLGRLLANWTKDDASRATRWQWLSFVLLLAALAGLAPPMHWVARRVVARDPSIARPSRLHRAVTALWTALVLACLPVLALLAFDYALDAFDLSYPQLQEVQQAFFDGLKIILVANAIARAILSPGQPAWRILDFSEPVVQRILRVWLGVAAVVALEKLLEPIDNAVSASLNVTVATRGACGLAAALLIAHGLRRIYTSDEAALLTGQQTRDTWAPLRTLAWLITLVIFCSVIVGYVAFATFLLGQIVQVAGLVAILYLIGIVVEAGSDMVLQPKATVGRSLTMVAGLRKETLEQLAVLVQGGARVALFLAAAFLILTPWGLQSQDMLGTLRAAYFGFKYGDVTISVSSIVTATFVLIVGVLITRAVQEWLGSRLLPRTRLDDGLRNSIRTIFGYVGVILALVVSGGQLGLNFQRLALIAGALSVGIGFGLQSVVNNFVSGLIILWERAVRVGDMVVVGADSGFVRRINVRSTEIETFDRATLIVPNSNLVSGVVKNWVRADRVGRIIIALNVPFDSDPEQVREILIAAAKGQDLTLSIPAPLVLFSDFGEWALKFQLICFVDEIEMADRVKSEILFDLHRRLKEAGLRIPYPRQDVEWLGGSPGEVRPA
jgi:potassium-dependent mechanosensitive channel